MNKQTFSIEFSFDVDTGTIELLDNDKWCVNQLIAPEVFIERYRNYKLDLMDKTHIEATAQQVLKIAEAAIKNAFGKNGGCVRDTRTEFTTEIDHVDIADIVYPGYTLWYDEYGDIGARCGVLIVVDVFTEVNAHIDDIKLYQALNVVMRRALKDAGIYDKITWFDFDF
jgi:hypothetical protein